MKILVNERKCDVPDLITSEEIRLRYKPDADLVVVNGYPEPDSCPLKEGDRVVLIRRGEIPAAEELEALMMARHTPGVHARLKGACVGIAGVGGLGSSLAVALARCGVGSLILADFDVVEPSNLNRQQYFIDQIGLPKVVALQNNLRRINPQVEISTFFGRLDSHNIPEVFAGVDILVEAFDSAEQKAILVSTFRRHFPERPLVAASGLAGYDSANSIVTRKVGERFYLVGDGVSAAQPGRGLMAPRTGIAAHHQANAVLRLILGLEPHED